jgi:ABC-type nitrate/sulfonate/bicarbonate transport system substrate-binding protein
VRAFPPRGSALSIGAALALWISACQPAPTEPLWPDRSTVLEQARATTSAQVAAGQSVDTKGTLRVGYSPGERTALLTQLEEMGAFTGAPISLYWPVGHHGTQLVPALSVETRDDEDAAGDGAALREDSRVLGPQLAAAMVQDRLDCAIMDAGTLLVTLSGGLDWTALAHIGSKSSSDEGHSLWVNNGLDYAGGTSLHGRSLVSMAEGPMTQMALYALVESLGADRNQVRIDAQVQRSEIQNRLGDDATGFVFASAHGAQRVATAGRFRKLPLPASMFVDVALNQDLLVCSRDALDAHEDAAVSLLAAIYSSTAPADPSQWQPDETDLATLEGLLARHGMLTLPALSRMVRPDKLRHRAAMLARQDN